MVSANETTETEAVNLHGRYSGRGSEVKSEKFTDPKVININLNLNIDAIMESNKEAIDNHSSGKNVQ